MKILALLLIIIETILLGCKKEPEKNRVDLQQIKEDDSNDYRYIFKDTIQEQEDRKNKYKKKNF